MKVYIAECKPKGIFPILSYAIRIAQKGLDFSHYALITIDNKGLVKSIDASGRTLHQENIENFLLKYDIVRIYQTPYSICQDQFYDWLYPLEGVSYGYSQLLGLFLMILNLYTTNPFKNGLHSLICNEFALQFAVDFHVIDKNTKIEDKDLLQTHKIIEEKFIRKPLSELLG